MVVPHNFYINGSGLRRGGGVGRDGRNSQRRDVGREWGGGAGAGAAGRGLRPGWGGEAGTEQEATRSTRPPPASPMSVCARVCGCARVCECASVRVRVYVRACVGAVLCVDWGWPCAVRINVWAPTREEPQERLRLPHHSGHRTRSSRNRWMHVSSGRACSPPWGHGPWVALSCI